MVVATCNKGCRSLIKMFLTMSMKSRFDVPLSAGASAAKANIAKLQPKTAALSFLIKLCFMCITSFLSEAMIQKLFPVNN